VNQEEQDRGVVPCHRISASESELKALLLQNLESGGAEVGGATGGVLIDLEAAGRWHRFLEGALRKKRAKGSRPQKPSSRLLLPASLPGAYSTRSYSGFHQHLASREDLLLAIFTNAFAPGKLREEDREDEEGISARPGQTGRFIGSLLEPPVEARRLGLLEFFREQSLLKLTELLLQLFAFLKPGRQIESAFFSEFHFCSSCTHIIVSLLVVFLPVLFREIKNPTWSRPAWGLEILNLVS
jgi:hypothetical protein